MKTCQQCKKLFMALSKLHFAAMKRDGSQGDPLTYLQNIADLRAASQAAEAVLREYAIDELIRRGDIKP